MEIASAAPSPSSRSNPNPKPVGADGPDWTLLPNRAANATTAPAAEPRKQTVRVRSNETLDTLDPIAHQVRSGDTLWTISQRYYGTSRYHKALLAANADQIGESGQLRQGMTIQVPPLEALDRSLVEAPRPAIVGNVSPAPASAPEAKPSPYRSNDASAETDATPAASAAPSQSPSPTATTSDPIYYVRKHETLRSIARDLLGDSRRYVEIMDRNADLIADPYEQLEAGLELRMPKDAKMPRN